MQFVDLKRQYLEYKNEIDREIKTVIDSTSFINGSAVRELEAGLENDCGAKHVIGCSSGTDALLLCLLAKDIKTTDEIIVPAFTYFATASMVSMTGAVPVFADVDPETFNINPAEIEKKITDRTKGIIAVSLYGQCAGFDEIKRIIEKNNLFLIEDGAQSYGAEYRGIKSCAITEMATTSFFPAKPLGCFGDGGAVFTKSDELAEKIRKLLNHGQRSRYNHQYIGINGRLDSIQAAVLKVKLKYFNKEINARQKIAKQYSSLLDGYVKVPFIRSCNTSSWAQYTICHKERDKIAGHLKQKKIPSAIHYPMVIKDQDAFSYLNDNDSYPVSEELSKTVLSLPMHPFLTETEIEIISDAVKEAVI